jgi:hypothetical protein
MVDGAYASLLVCLFKQGPDAVAMEVASWAGENFDDRLRPLENAGFRADTASRIFRYLREVPLVVIEFHDNTEEFSLRRKVSEAKETALFCYARYFGGCIEALLWFTATSGSIESF